MSYESYIEFSKQVEEFKGQLQTLDPSELAKRHKLLQGESLWSLVGLLAYGGDIALSVVVQSRTPGQIGTVVVGMLTVAGLYYFRKYGTEFMYKEYGADLVISQAKERGLPVKGHFPFKKIQP